MNDPQTVLAAWVADLGRELGLDLEVDVEVLLDLAGDAAHGVVRPAAPLTTFLVGVAVGRGARLDDTVEAVGRVLARREAPQP